MAVQDEERRRIARELHDGLGQYLAGVKMSIDGALAALAGHVGALDGAANLLDDCISEIRTLSHLLHPPLLEEVGLMAAIPWYVTGFQEGSGIDASLDMAENFERLSSRIELALFRVLQESLTNIHRHSGSKTANIQVLREPERVLVEVRDQGEGIPAEKLAQIQTKSSGVGIRGMRERLRQFNGEMIMDSTNLGTTVLIAVPISEHRNSAETKACSTGSGR